MNISGPEIVFTIAGLAFTQSVVWGWIIMGLLLSVGCLAARNLKEKPGLLQNIFELFIYAIESLLKSVLGPEAGPKYFSFIGSLFLFVFCSNIIGVIPKTFSPTADLNTTLGLGLLVAIMAHGSGMVKQGTGKYIYGFFQPYWLMVPLNLIGELGKLLSHSFRLFGNVAGGGILMGVIMFLASFFMPSATAVENDGVMTHAEGLYLIVWTIIGLGAILFGPQLLLRWKGENASTWKKRMAYGGILLIFGIFLSLAFPAVLNLWFGCFSSLVQAFIFSTLAMAYTAVARG